MFEFVDGGSIEFKAPNVVSERRKDLVAALLSMEVGGNLLKISSDEVKRRQDLYSLFNGKSFKSKGMKFSSTKKDSFFYVKRTV